MFLYEITHRYLKNGYSFFDTLKTKDSKIRGNYNLLTKVKFHKLKWSSPLRTAILQLPNKLLKIPCVNLSDCTHSGMTRRSEILWNHAYIQYLPRLCLECLSWGILVLLFVLAKLDIYLFRSKIQANHHNWTY